ncbi:NADP-dependent oxidoreductase [Kribbella sancticallisti]|uniref:NADP-dependent oxidoreductase n=1 Tax=Kribbella sancticallisti TaxID=460087 RepID=A0ABP4PW05_9ACTN
MNDQLTGQEIRLAARPAGEPGPEHFELATVPVPELKDGQVLVRNTWISVDPYMRGRMDDEPGALPPFELGKVMDGSAIGEVIASRAPAIPVGATVNHFLGWREYSVVDAAAAIVEDVTLAPAEAYLGVLGTTGLTAYAALTDVTGVKEGDVVFVSAAAGAVGSVAGQIARQLGAAKVIGSAGGPLKTKKLLADFGYDAALDYKAGDLAGQLEAAAPDGIDVYLDNVGGSHLQAALDRLNPGGRVALIGAVSGYNTPMPPADNLVQAVYKSLSLRGMQVANYFPLFPEYVGHALGWIAAGRLHTEQTVVDGLDQAPAALIGVLRGENTGKMLVRL